VVLYVLVCGALPFDGSSLTLLRDRVLSGRFRIPFFMSSDCESLLRRILVLDPAKRFNIQQIKNHAWMQIEAPPTTARTQLNPSGDSTIQTGSDGKSVNEPTLPSTEPTPVNEQILRLMQDLGIDPVRTKESVCRELYDHHSAIYYLLVDRLNQQKQSLGKQAADQKKRRPSTIAEQPLKGLACTENFQSLRLRTTSESDKETEKEEKAGGSGMSRTKYECITCGCAILENTSSTTSCVKCARLRRGG